MNEIIPTLAELTCTNRDKELNMSKYLLIIAGFSLFLANTTPLNGQQQESPSEGFTGIQVFSENPWYWQYRGEPVILRGGSNDDNPFQWEAAKLTDELDLLQSVGGNYLRNTMSDREDFYSTVDRGAGNELEHQQRYIDKLLSITLDCGNVLYNINNESSESGDWENYWAMYIKDAAGQAGRQVYVTNMQLSASNAVRHVMTHSRVFDFVDISQNNQDSKGARGPAHWDNLMFLREKIASSGPVPMNNVKIYGATDIGKQYAVYFPQGRYTINLDPWVYVDELKLQWLDINDLEWSEPEVVKVQWEGGKDDWGFRGAVSLETPGNRPCIALLEVVPEIPRK